MTNIVVPIRYNKNIEGKEGDALSIIKQMQKKLGSLSEQIEELNNQLESLEVKECGHQNNEYSLEEIYARAKRSNRSEHILYQVEPEIKEAYVKLIILVTGNSMEWTNARLILLYELLYSIEYFIPFEELMINKLRLNGEQKFIALEMVENYRGSLMLDILLISYVEGSVANEQATIIASLAALMEIGEEDLTFISLLARCLIEQDEGTFKKLGETNSKKWRGIFNSYLPEEWLKRSRVYCGTANISYYTMENLSYVKKGLLLYETKSKFILRLDLDTKIYARAHGFLYEVLQDGMIAYYIISCFDDPEKLSLPFKR